MLAIRMQRTGRKGHPEFRVVVQDSALSPTSGRIVARVGNHNPHTKQTVLDIDKINHYLTNGAQPSPRVVRLLQAEKKITLPDWVKIASSDKTRKIKNTDKLRRNQPKVEPVAEEMPTEAEAPTIDESEVVVDDATPEADASVETTEEKPAE